MPTRGNRRDVQQIRRHPHQTSQCICARGFTLIELIVVIVIAAILAAVTVPSLQSMGRARSGTAAATLHADLTYARQAAVSTGLRHWVVLSDDHGWRLLIENRDDPGRAASKPLADPATGSAYRIDLDEPPFLGVRITDVTLGPNQEVAFDWLGRPWLEDGTRLTSEGAITLSGGERVTIEPGSGYASRAADSPTPQ